LLASGAAAVPCAAGIIPVAPGESVQAAIEAAGDGDTIALAAGTYVEDIDFLGKAVTVLGEGPDTVLQGTGTGSVVRFVSGEGPDSVLDSVVVTGGLAERGGGILITDASPTVRRNIVFANRARRQGSGIHVERSSASIHNNAVLYNSTAQVDPHSVEVVDASPAIVNNTIARNDSNGIILRGASPAEVRNNAILLNGSRGRGRGICDFSGGVAEIAYNLFWKNKKAALLTDGSDFRSIRRAQILIGPPRLEGNGDGKPELSGKAPPRLGSKAFERLTLAELLASLAPDGERKRLRLTDAGDPDPSHDDADGSRNDIGFTGGPHAPAW
jgi:nitrous oxidase accessory protein NosD